MGVATCQGCHRLGEPTIITCSTVPECLKNAVSLDTLLQIRTVPPLLKMFCFWDRLRQCGMVAGICCSLQRMVRRRAKVLPLPLESSAPYMKAVLYLTAQLSPPCKSPVFIFMSFFKELAEFESTDFAFRKNVGIAIFCRRRRGIRDFSSMFSSNPL